MNEYFTNKNVLLGILLTLFSISIVDVVLRATTFNDIAGSLSNYGEPLVTAVLSVLLLIFALKGKDRVFYILCGGWLAFFVLSQIFGFPGMIPALTYTWDLTGGINSSSMAVLIHLFSMVCIIGVGALLVEYLNDGTIYNSAFKILCIVTFLMLIVSCALGVYDISKGEDYAILAILNNLSRMAMLFLFTYFAYDSAKTQLSKTQL